MSLLFDMSFSVVDILVVNGIFAVPAIEVLVLVDVVYSLIFKYLESHIFLNIPTSFRHDLKLISISRSDKIIKTSHFLFHIRHLWQYN